MPALLTRIEMGPTRRVTLLIKSSASSILVTSCGCARAAGPSCCAALRSNSSRRPTSTTRAPDRTKHRATPNPSPLPPPVMSAVSPASEKALSAVVCCFILNHLKSGSQVAQGESHPGMPGRGAGHLRRVIGNDDTIKTIFVENPEHPENVDVAVINKGFAIVRHFAGDIAAMDISELSLPAVDLHGLVEVARGHFGKRAQAELQRVSGAGFEIQHALVKLWLIH